MKRYTIEVTVIEVNEHGERRQDVRTFTPDICTYDLEVCEQIAQVLDAAANVHLELQAANSIEIRWESCPCL